jgi:sec-independent protein translocase protein TatB
MLNVGPLELLVVLAVALIVVGPERLPELARSVGRVLRQLRDVQDEVRDMVRMGVDEEMRQAATDVKRATSDLRRAGNVAGSTRRAGRSLRSGAREAFAEPDAPRGRSTGDDGTVAGAAPGDAEITPIDPDATAPGAAEGPSAPPDAASELGPEGPGERP